MKNRSFTKIEAAWLVLLAGTYLVVLHPLLFTGSRMFAHDTIWYYGLMRHFYNALLNGFFPYWDPYNYSGQPFYYNLGIARIFEIPSLFVIFVNRFVKGSLLSMYHWDVVLRFIISSLGVYFSFRQTNRYRVSDLVVFAGFLFSSYGISSMRQCGLMTSFMWTPWMLFFILRASKEFSAINVVGLSLFTGWSVTSYQAGYPLTFLQLFIFSMVVTRPRAAFGFLKNKKNMALVLFGAMIVVLLSLQVFSVYIEKDRSVPVLRRDGDPESVSFTDLRGGRAASYRDFAGLIFPARVVRPRDYRGGSEGYLYAGFAPFLLAIGGLLLSKDSNKRIFIVTMLLVVYLMLGYQFRLGAIPARALFPFLIFSRHMQLFQPFFLLCFFYFVGQGADVFMDLILKDRIGPVLRPVSKMSSEG